MKEYTSSESKFVHVLSHAAAELVRWLKHSKISMRRIGTEQNIRPRVTW